MCNSHEVFSWTMTTLEIYSNAPDRFNWNASFLFRAVWLKRTMKFIIWLSLLVSNLAHKWFIFRVSRLKSYRPLNCFKYQLNSVNNEQKIWQARDTSHNIHMKDIGRNVLIEIEATGFPLKFSHFTQNQFEFNNLMMNVNLTQFPCWTCSNTVKCKWMEVSTFFHFVCVENKSTKNCFQFLLLSIDSEIHLQMCFALVSSVKAKWNTTNERRIKNKIRMMLKYVHTLEIRHTLIEIPN